MPDSQDSRTSDKANNENMREYYLIRVPKNIDIKELNGAQIDLSTFGPSTSVIQSESEPDQSYGYDIISSKTTAFSNVTRLDTAGDEIRIDDNFMLRGCINFYTHKCQPESELKPLVAVSPNDPIEDIVNLARGHSTKRKLTKQSKESPKKSAKTSQKN